MTKLLMEEKQENRRLGLQKGLAKRVKKRDPEGKLSCFYPEYLYWPDMNFGVIFKDVSKTILLKVWDEAISNAPEEGKAFTLLIISRPGDNIYVVCSSSLYWVDRIIPILYLESDVGLCICRFEDFIEEAPSHCGG